MPAVAPDRLVAAALRVNGSERSDLYQCIESMVVTEDPDRGSSFEVRIALCRNDDGSWPHLDDPSLTVWNEVELQVRFPQTTEPIMRGFISHVTQEVDEAAGAATLTIQGVDALYFLQLADRRRVWVGKSYEQIAVAIIGAYDSFTAVPATAPDAGAPPDELPAVTQRGTDFRLLRELARRLGFELYARDREIHFHEAELTGTPQKLIAAAFGDQTNCRDLRVVQDGTGPTEVGMGCVNPLTGEPEEPEPARSTDTTPLGATDLSELRGNGLPQTAVRLRRMGAQPLPLMRRLVQGAMRRRSWWVRATGTLNGLRYGAVLRPHRLVTIKGFGRSQSGLYYVRKVTHRLDNRSYRMEFEAVRNRIGQLGSEDFEGESPEDAAGALSGAAGG